MMKATKAEVQAFKRVSARNKACNDILSTIIDEKSCLELTHKRLWEELGKKYGFDPNLNYTLEDDGTIISDDESEVVH